jgi:hypothetical protein
LSTKEEKALMRHKWTPEGFLESGRDHTGRILDNTSMDKIPETLIMIGCGYFGARAAQRHNPDPEAVAGGALAAMIGYKLATTFGGTPPISQIAGLAILGSVGVTNVQSSEPVRGVLEQLGASLAAVNQAKADAESAACADCNAQGGTCGDLIDFPMVGEYLTCTLGDGTKRFIKV